jgi:hypothetical protein
MIHDFNVIISSMNIMNKTLKLFESINYLKFENNNH